MQIITFIQTLLIVNKYNNSFSLQLVNLSIKYIIFIVSAMSL